MFRPVSEAYVRFSFFILGVQLCLRCFSPKFEVLFLKNDYLFMIQITVRRWPLLFHLSGNCRIPYRKNDVSFEAIYELIHFLTSS